jgi:hypothetical protein
VTELEGNGARVNGSQTRVRPSVSEAAGPCAGECAGALEDAGHRGGTGDQATDAPLGSTMRTGQSKGFVEAGDQHGPQVESQ